MVTDRWLCRSRHVAALKTKLRSFVRVLHVVAAARWGTSESSLLQLYQALFISYIRYSLPELLSLGLSCMLTLESIYAQALCTCLSLPWCTSTNGRIGEAGASSTDVNLLCVPLRMYFRVFTQNRHDPSSSLATILLRRKNHNFLVPVFQEYPRGYCLKLSLIWRSLELRKRHPLRPLASRDLSYFTFLQMTEIMCSCLSMSLTSYGSTAVLIIPHMILVYRPKLDPRSTLFCRRTCCHPWGTAISLRKASLCMDDILRFQASYNWLYPQTGPII